MRAWGVLACLGWVAACGDNAAAPRLLSIVDPPAPTGGGGKLCTAGDADADTPGLQVDLHVATSGFRTGDKVELLLDGAATDREATITDGVAIFAAVSLPEDFHVLVVTSEDATVLSEPLFLFVDSDPPPLTILAPDDRARLENADDVDPATDGVQADIQLDADVEDGQPARITVTSANGAEEGYSARVEGRRASVRVTLPQGSVRVAASTENLCGNAAEAHVDVAVGGASLQACTLELDPLPGELLGGGLVYSIALDPSPDPAFQTQVRVRTALGSTVELELDGELVTTALAEDGTLEVPLALADGARLLGAVCRDPFGQVDRSAVTRLLVDTVAPTCTILSPAAGVTLVPVPIGGQTRELRVDVGVSGDEDTDGEPVDIDVAGDLGTSTVQGEIASRIVTLAAPDDGLAIVMTGRDHAGNSCTSTLEVAYVTEGCSLEWLTPSALVNQDGDGALPGVQADLRVRVGEACLGRTVSLSGCATTGTLTAVADAGGLPEAVFPGATVCAQGICQTSRQCVASVTREGPITTTLTHTVVIDTQPPSLLLVPIAPSVSCGASLTPADDVDPGTDGVQVELLLATDAVERSIAQTPAGAPIVLVGNRALATLATGLNRFVATGRDAGGLEATSAPCLLRLGTLGIEIDSPADNALLGADDGVVSGTFLLTEVCGTVGEAATASVVVSVDGGPDVSATVDPATGAWCAVDVPLAAGPHVVTAVGTSSSGSSGDAAIAVSVEITPPGPVQSLSAAPLDRRSVEISFVEPADATGCRIKRANTAIVDDAAWDALAGEGIAVGGGSPGATVSQVVAAKPGRPWFFAVRCLDAAGNRSPLVATTAPLVLDFTRGLELGPAPIPGYDIGDSLFGEVIVGADLDGDGLHDLAVSAPQVLGPASGFGDGAVYVFLARPGGITQATPDYVIVGATDSMFGQGLARVDWNHDGIDDLAIGAPFGRGFQGEVTIFYGGPAFSPQSTMVVRSEAEADVEITADAADPFFAFAALGWSLDRVDFDGDGRDELLIGTPARVDFAGGAVVLFAPATGAPPPSLALPSDLGPATGAVAYGFDFPSYPDPSGRSYGTDVVGLGRLSADAAEDILVAPAVNKGTFQSSGGETVSQSHFVYYGRGRPLAAAPFQVLGLAAAAEELVMPVEENNGGYGFSVSATGDLNGDGRRELVVGYPTADVRTGAVLIFPGGTSTGARVVWQESQAIVRIDGRGFNSLLGNAVAGGGDLDGDLVADLLFCSARDGDRPHLYGWFGGEGTAHVDLDEDPPFLPEVPSPTGWDHCASVAFVGDLNGDGLADVVWGDKNGERRPEPPLPPRPQRIEVLY